MADLTGLRHAPAAADLVAVAPQLAYAVLVAAVVDRPAVVEPVAVVGR